MRKRKSAGTFKSFRAFPFPFRINHALCIMNYELILRHVPDIHQPLAGLGQEWFEEVV